MSAVVIREGLVHYEAIGRGKPLLFIHGWLGSWRYWVPTMEELSSKYRTYALDLWGFGDSDKLKTYYTIDAYVELLGEFMDQLGILSIPLVGHALGGIVALLFAARHPERVEMVIGVSVPLMGEALNRPLAGFSGNGDALEKLIARRANFPEVSLEARKTDSAAVAVSADSAMKCNVNQMLPLLEKSVLLVHGGNDPLVRPPEPGWLEDCDEGTVRPILLDGVEHFPMLEERNKFNRLLMSFLESGGDLNAVELKEEWQRRLR